MTNIAPRDQNHVPSTVFEVDGAPGTVDTGKINQVTGRILVESGGGGSGTVTSFSFTDSNGFDGTVTDSTTTPALSLAITASGMLKGTTGAIGAATAGTDYVAPGAITTSGLTMDSARLLGRSTASTGAIEEITVGSGLDLTAGTLTATGGVSPGGSTTQLQYNNAGSFGGITGATTDGTSVTLTSPTIATSLLANYATASTVPIFDASKNLISADTATYPTLTELSYVKGVTSSIQTQLNAKGAGTVTSVGASVPTGLTIAGSPVTGAGTLAIGLDTGYVIPLQTTLDGKANTALSNLSSVAINTSLLPGSNDGAGLGSGTLSFSDLFLASGGVINFANGNSVITHSSGVLDVTTGDLQVSTAGTNADSVVTNAGTQTLTNKRVTPRVSSETSSATPTINTDNVDAHKITALATNITSMTTNLSGTPTDFQKLIIRILDNGTPRTITWGASFASMGPALPTTTTTSKVLTCGFIWDSVAMVWGLQAVNVQP